VAPTAAFVVPSPAVLLVSSLAAMTMPRVAMAAGVSAAATVSAAVAPLTLAAAILPASPP
jgi:hypothetical protein